MKKYRTLIILAAAAILLCGIYIWMETTDDATISGSLYRMAEDETITGIKISNLYGNYEFVQDDKQEWGVAADGNVYRTHDNKMELVIGALENIVVTRVLEEEIPDYGLESPQAVVTCTTSKGNTHSFAIGNETVSHSEVYIRDQRNGKVMVTSTGSVAQFTGSLSAYRDKEIFTIDKNSFFNYIHIFSLFAYL